MKSSRKNIYWFRKYMAGSIFMIDQEARQIVHIYSDATIQVAVTGARLRH